MRHWLPFKSRAWWAILFCSLVAVAIFMVFEVLDLDGSDLYRRIFQPPIPSQPTVAWAEGGMRHGAFAIHEALGHLQARESLRQPSMAVPHCRDATSAILGKRLTVIRPRTGIPRPSVHPPAPSNEPPSTTRRAI